MANRYLRGILTQEGERMKDLAILSSGKFEEYNSILEYFKGKDVKITCICTDFKSDVYDLAKAFENVKVQCVSAGELFKYFSENTFNLVAVRNCSEELKPPVLNTNKFINLHQSLLPSFSGNDALFRAFNSGVKVTGITVHYLTSNIDGGKIITQYPILISNLMHFDELQKETAALENKIYPIVIEKILQDKVFDFQDFLQTGRCHGSESCTQNCSSCKNCSDANN